MYVVEFFQSAYIEFYAAQKSADISYPPFFAVRSVAKICGAKQVRILLLFQEIIGFFFALLFNNIVIPINMQVYSHILIILWIFGNTENCEYSIVIAGR